MIGFDSVETTQVVTKQRAFIECDGCATRIYGREHTPRSEAYQGAPAAPGWSQIIHEHGNSDAVLVLHSGQRQHACPACAVKVREALAAITKVRAAEPIVTAAPSLGFGDPDE